MFAVWLGWVFRTTVGMAAGVAAEPQALRVRANTKMGMVIKYVFFILKSVGTKNLMGKDLLILEQSRYFQRSTRPAK